MSFFVGARAARRAALLVTVPVALSAAPVWAGPAEPVTIGQRLSLQSKVLGEERVYLVHLPPGYEVSAQRYPVLYLTDAEAHFALTAATADFLARAGLAPPMIVVGVGNTDRTRDLTPTRASLPQPGGGQVDFPTAGGAERFLDFFERELVPQVDKDYRTLPFRVFCGHSFGGLFGVHALVSRPGLFGAVVAVSPTLHWDEQLPVRRLRELLETRDTLHKTLVVTLGREGPQMEAGFDALERLLTSARNVGFEWATRRFPDDDHGSLVLASHEFGLRRVFAGWRPPQDPATGEIKATLDELLRHYRKLSARYGAALSPPENIVNNLGYAALARKDIAAALGWFELNARQYPDSANVHDSLGEALAAAGRTGEARERFARAVELGEKTKDRNLAVFRQHLETARQGPQAESEPKGDR